MSTAAPSYDASDDEPKDWGVDTVAKSHIVLAIYGIICVLGIAGNLLVCVVLLRVPSLRSNTSYFLVHLSLVDFVVAVFVIPYKLTPAAATAAAPNPGLFGEIWCRFYTGQFFFWVCCYTSVFSLVTVNMERYIAIVHPHKYKFVFTKRNKYLMIIACWLLSSITESFVLFLFTEDEVKGCHFLNWPSWGVQSFLGVYTCLVVLFIPFVVMITAQCKVILTLKGQVKALTARTASSTLNQADKREMWQLRAAQTLVRTLLVCVITFAVCWAPNQTIFLLYNLGVYDLDFSTPIYHFTVILAVCNSCLNPIIYTMTNKPFRKGIRRTFYPNIASEVGSMGTSTLVV